MGNATAKGGDQVYKYDLAKEIADRLLAAMGLVLLAPVGAGAALICGLSGEGIFYGQERIGKAGKPFTVWKFRTMRRDAPVLPRAQLSSPDQYYIPGGRFLRSAGIDELPQLWCVVKGEMSLVGPRPLLASETAVHRLRNEWGVYALRPGITGLAQLCGDPPPLTKAKLDVLYLQEHSLWLDVCVLMSTVGVVMRKKGRMGKIPSRGKLEKSHKTI